MKSFNFLLAGITIHVACVYAHTTFTNFYVDGTDQGDAKCVRMNMDPKTATTFVPDLESPEMACG